MSYKSLVIVASLRPIVSSLLIPSCAIKIWCNNVHYLLPYSGLISLKNEGFLDYNIIADYLTLSAFMYVSLNVYNPCYMVDYVQPLEVPRSNINCTPIFENKKVSFTSKNFAAGRAN